LSSVCCCDDDPDSEGSDADGDEWRALEDSEAERKERGTKDRKRMVGIT